MKGIQIVACANFSFCHQVKVKEFLFQFQVLHLVHLHRTLANSQAMYWVLFCNNYIAKINRIKQIYTRDMKKLEVLRSNAVYRIMPAIMRQIVFTKKEIEEESGVTRNTVSNLIDKLVEINILVPDSNYAKLDYRYNEIYNVFVGKDI